MLMEAEARKLEIFLDGFSVIVVNVTNEPSRGSLASTALVT